MSYGPGASVKLWQKLIPKAKRWEAEFDGTCVDEARRKGQLEGTLVGDQENKTVLNQWVDQSGGGHFDVIIDDGGHHNCQIFNSFITFWPLQQPGGLYFIDDLQVSKVRPFSGRVDERGNETIMVNIVKDWIELLIDNRVFGK